MGNYRFRLSDMIPNAWFHKFKNMNGTTTATSTGRRAKMQSGSGGGSYRKKEHTPSSTNTGAPPQFHSQTLVKPGRASYYIPSRCEDKFPANPRSFDTNKYLVDPPRKSKKNHSVGRPLVKPSPNVVTSSISSACPCRPTITEDSEHNDDRSGNGGIDDDLDGLPCLEKTVIASSNCRTAISATDIIVDVKGCRKPEKTIQEFDLPPILTKPTKKEVWSVPKSVQKSPRRRSSAGSQGVKMRASTPRLSSKKLRAHRCRKSSALAPMPRRGLAGSFTVVKSSSNPQRDFRESMMEMIVANNIHAAAELEELLACYLSLNSSEYHDVIVKVFEQIWYDITDIKL